jgi:WD40 repeat protein
VAWSPVGDLLAAGGDGPLVYLIDPAGGGVIRTLQGPARGIQVVAFSPDAHLLAAAGWDNTITIWDTDSWLIRQNLQLANGFASSLAFNPELGLFLAVDFSHIHIWDTGSWQKLCTLVSLLGKYAVVYTGQRFDVSDPEALNYIRFSTDTVGFAGGLFADRFRVPGLLSLLLPHGD